MAKLYLTMHCGIARVDIEVSDIQNISRHEVYSQVNISAVFTLSK